MTHTPPVTVTAKTVVKLARGVRLREDTVRGQTVLLAPERTFALDDIAVAIVRALDGERDLGTIAENLATRFEAETSVVLKDVIDFVEAFSKRQLLEQR
jgi:pyrroloquinoline quinone biosynthesis protein D